MNRLDEIIEALKSEQVPGESIERAGARVRGRLFARAAAGLDRIRSCADYQALIPAYLGRSLSAGRTLLLQDHTRECVACRQALEQARSGAPPMLVRPITMPSRTISKYWAIAAMAILTIGAGWFLGMRLFRSGAARDVAVHTVSGILYAVSDRGSAPVFSGRRIAEGEIVRTAKNSTAVVRLGDGSLVEMNERSELSVIGGGAGATIRLHRGDIIVQAAKQRSGSLDVLTPDFLISVKGTVFSVSRGTKGSRVSVIEGAVNVERGSQGQLLKPGDQVVTDPSLEKIPVALTVAWSADASKYVALLGELSILEKRLDSALPAGLRFQSKLLGYATPSTVVFAAVPNLGSAIGEAQKVLQERLRQSEVLREWWNEHNGRGKLEETIEKLRASSEFLGEEIVLTVDGDWAGHFSPPLVLAELKRPGLREFLEAEIRQMRIRGEKPLPEIVELKTDAEQSKSFYLRERGANQAADEHMLIGIKDDLVAVAWNQQQIDRLTARFRHGPQPAGSGGLFNNVLRAYEKGVGWILAIDMEHIARASVDKDKKRSYLPPGLEAMRYLIVERKETAGKKENEATLSFEGRRAGMAGWLAEPASMGTLDFVSPHATMAVSMVLRRPEGMLNDLIAYLRSQNENVDAVLERIHRETGVRPVEDIGPALGGEITFALDGPLMPLPSWKMAVEVYSPDRLQWAIERLVESANRDQKCENCSVRIAKEQVGSRVFHSLSAGVMAYEVHYVYADGYMVAAPSRMLLTQALQNRQTGFVLARSEAFRAQLPRNGSSNFSALLYGNAESLVKPLAGQMDSVTALTPEQRAAIQALANNSSVGLIYAYGENDRIVLANRGAMFGLDLGTLALPRIIGGALNPPKPASRMQ